MGDHERVGEQRHRMPPHDERTWSISGRRALVPVGPPDLRTSGPRGEARFEVSDVLKTRDGNRKLQKDVERLMNLPPGVTGFLVGTDMWEGRVIRRGYAYAKVRDTLIAQV